MSRTRPFADPAVKAVFDAYPRSMRADLLALRALIFEAAAHPAIGPLVETLKWGQPAYLPTTPRGAKLPRDKLKHCIQMELTYYVRLAA